MESTWLAPRFALITCTQKLPDRFVFTASLPVEARAGDPLILITLEVRQPWRSESRLVSTITDVLSQRYPTIRRSTNPLQSFELTLKNVNEELMGLAETGETEWIGRLNGVIALVVGNEVHVAHTGQATAYLFRQQKISQILERPDVTDPHPLTTFANIISGYTNAGDRLVLGNEDLFTLVPPESLRAAVSDETPWQGVQTIARSLKRTRVLSVAAAVLGIEQAKTWEEVGDEPIVVNLEEYTRTWTKKLWIALKPILAEGKAKAGAALSKTKTVAAQGSEKWRAAVVPKAREMWQSRVPKKNQTEKRHEPARTPSPVAPATRDWAASAESAVTLSIAAPLAKLAAPLTKILSRAESSITSVIGRRTKISLSGGYNRWVIIGVAVILVAIAARGVSSRRANMTESAQVAANENFLNEAASEIDKLRSSIRLKEKDEAGQRLTVARETIAKVKEPTSEQTTRLNELETALVAADDELNQVTRLTAAQDYVVTGAPNLLAVNDGYFVTASSEKSNLRLLSRQTGTVAEVSSDALSSLTYDSDRAQFIGVRETGEVVALSGTDSDRSTPNTLPVTESSIPKGPVRTFSRNLYTVDLSSGSLLKFAASADGYAKPTTLVAEESLKTALDIAIDGAIFVLKSDNTVAKYSRGRLDATFALKDTPVGVAFNKIFTDSQSDQIYCVDHKAGRISVFDKTGQYQKQYALDETSASVLQVDASAKRAYAIFGDRLAEYSL